MGLVGGEGMSEGCATTSTNASGSVYSGYGATDIEIGMAGESPLCVASGGWRRATAGSRRALFGDDPRLPMLFQYNPLNHFI